MSAAPACATPVPTFAQLRAHLTRNECVARNSNSATADPAKWPAVRVSFETAPSFLNQDTKTYDSVSASARIGYDLGSLENVPLSMMSHEAQQPLDGHERY
jgi:hypothetical protein